MSIIKLDQKLKRLEVKDFEIQNEIVFKYFDSQPLETRDEKFIRALYIGVLALMEDRISAFFSKTSNELGTELESLKMIFEMKKELFYKSSVKGTLAEEDVAEFLINFCSDKKLEDDIVLIGNESGSLNKNKTGDILCVLNNDNNQKIVIECKFDKSIKLGAIENKDIFTKKTDTAWSQLIEAQVNRNCNIAILVLDYSFVDNNILQNIENVRYLPEIGFIAIIDSQKGDFSNLAIAYMLARDIAINAKPINLDKNLLSLLINRIIKDIYEATKIKDLVLSNIDNNKKILSQLEKSILLMRFNQEYLSRFLDTGVFTKHDLLEFYSGERVSEAYKFIEKEIQNI